MRTSFKILTLLTVLSCSTKDTKTVDQKPLQDTQTLVNKTNLDKQEKLLLANVMTHYFSSPTIKDTFKIVLSGHTIIDSNFEFEIKTNYGLVIHNEIYPSSYLIGYGLDPNASETEQAEYIKNRVLTFFEEENFRQPAIEKDELFDADYSDLEVWNDIKADSTAVKFISLVGEEGIGHIAYSKKLKRVVMIFSCC